MTGSVPWHRSVRARTPIVFPDERLVEDALCEYEAAGVEPAGLRDAWQSARSFAIPAEKPKS
jgi:hypothetical protein